MDPDQTVAWRGRRVRLGVHPMGIDARNFADRASSREVSAEALALRSDHARLLVGVDRLDYSKGILRRMHSLEALLEMHPEWRERVRLVQIAVPTRGGVHAYRRFRHDLEALVGRINGRFGTPNWTPIQYVHRAIPDTQLSALYRAADVMLVTPLRDGMNLVAKEFVASRVDEDGVLVLSEFAGAADELIDAVIVNPYDVEGTAHAIHRALCMDRTERRRRIQALRAQVNEHDVVRWSEGFIAALAATR
jgi:trehalose 6-phosphate synthase/phosphatase